MTESKRWLSRKEAADYLGLSVDAIDRLRFHHELPYSQPARNAMVRIDREELDRWMKDRERTGAA